jgi:hypothetical protein
MIRVPLKTEVLEMQASTVSPDTSTIVSLTMKWLCQKLLIKTTKHLSGRTRKNFCFVEVIIYTAGNAAIKKRGRSIEHAPLPHTEILELTLCRNLTKTKLPFKQRDHTPLIKQAIFDKNRLHYFPIPFFSRRRQRSSARNEYAVRATWFN